LDECHFDEAAEVFRRFLKSREDASGFFEPSYQALDNVASAVCFPIEFDGSCIAVFILFGRNDRADVPLQQILIDPIGAVPFVATQRHRPSDRFAVTVMQTRVGTF
jgi:hypothetical protein